MTKRFFYCALAFILIGAGSCREASNMHRGEHGAQKTAASQSGPTITLSPTNVVAVGQPVTLTLTLRDKSGTPLGPDAVALNHTQKVHVMIVDSGLEDYSHVHATPATRDGDWVVSFTPKFGRTYKIWADFKVAADGDPHSSHDMGNMKHDMGAMEMNHGPMPSATLVAGPENTPTISTTPSLSGRVDGLAFNLVLNGTPKVNQATTATLSVTDAASGQPFKALEPIMGAYAHLVGFSADSASMLHGHPEGAEPGSMAARGGPNLTFELKPEAAGVTRLFLQVQRNGIVVVVPFTLVVAP
jgi:hypothetical protein